jgi:isopentenyldiphosphate isomerase
MEREIVTVNYFDNVVGSAPINYAHKRGLLHRSVHVFIFKQPDYGTLLVQKRSGAHAEDPLKFGPSAAGHVDVGEDYLKAALREMKEEIFWEIKELPSGLKLMEIARGYRNDELGKCPENSALYYAVYAGPFSPNPEEVDYVQFVPVKNVIEDQKISPNLYTFSFINTMKHFQAWRAADGGAVAAH